MSTKSAPTAKPPRNSARIEARQHRMNETRVAPGWATPTATNEERRLIIALIDYLRDSTEDVGTMRYLTKEYWVLAPTIHTVPTTLKKVRMQLLELGVPYVRHHKNNRLWKYWNDYSEDGIEAWEKE